MRHIFRSLALVQREVASDASNAPADTTDQGPSLFIASTPVEARDGMIVIGWRLESYAANPIVLFNHDDEDAPIGKGEAFIDGDRLMVRVHWDWEDPEAADIARKVKAGYLNAVSVRWRPGEVIARWRLPKEDPMYAEDGLICKDNELLEISVVTVPADPLALVVERGAGSDLDARIRAAVVAEVARIRPALLAEAVAEAQARALTAPVPAPSDDWAGWTKEDDWWAS